mgnify:CR=1 FL=1
MNRSLLMALCILALTGTIQAQKPPKGSTTAAATSVLSDQLNDQVTRIGNDGQGSYLNGVNSVVSIVQGIGNWELDSKISSSRRVRIDLGDPVPGTGANAPFSSQFVPVRFISKCTTSIFTLAAGQSTSCPLALSITFNNTTYALRSEQANYPGTEPVTWTCLARDSTKCIGWQMVPSVVQADGERKVVMQLLKPAARQRDPDQLLGRFYMSFNIGVTTP